MDYFAHGFWSYIFFFKTKKPLYAVLLGLVPDTFSWGIYFFYNLFLNGFSSGQPHLTNIPYWVFSLYGLTHSLIVWGAVLIISYFIFNKKAVYVLAPLIAILMDIPTHSREFLPTPFLWPISEWSFPGFSWGNLTFMVVNYSLIIIALSYIFWKRYQGKKSKK